MDLSNNDIAEKFHFHPNYLNHLIALNTGVTLRQYLINQRIRTALNMILNTDMSVTEISRTVGYDNINYFSRLFKEKTGYSPNQLKRNKSDKAEL